MSRERWKGISFYQLFIIDGRTCCLYTSHETSCPTNDKTVQNFFVDRYTSRMLLKGSRCISSIISLWWSLRGFLLCVIACYRSYLFQWIPFLSFGRIKNGTPEKKPHEPFFCSCLVSKAIVPETWSVMLGGFCKCVDVSLSLLAKSNPAFNELELFSCGLQGLLNIPLLTQYQLVISATK